MYNLYILLQIILLIGYANGGKPQAKGQSMFHSATKQPISSGNEQTNSAGTDTGNQPVFDGTDTGNQSVFAGTYTGDKSLFAGIDTGNQSVFAGIDISPRLAADLPSKLPNTIREIEAEQRRRLMLLNSAGPHLPATEQSKLPFLSASEQPKSSVNEPIAEIDTGKQSIFSGKDASKSIMVSHGSTFPGKQHPKISDFDGKFKFTKPTGTMIAGQGTKQSAASMFARGKEEVGHATQHSKSEKGIGSSSSIFPKRTKLDADIRIRESVRNHPIPNGHTKIGPVVLITGTSKGIGEVVFRRLMQQDGVEVIIGTLRQTNSAIDELADNYSNETGKIVKIVPMEMNNKDSIGNGCQELRRILYSLVRAGKLKKPMINTIIHNAGVMDSIDENLGVHPLHVDYDVYLKHFLVNTLAPMFITSKLGDLLNESEQSPRVIFISSTVSSMGMFFGLRSVQNVAYPASKSAVNSYMKYVSDVKKELTEQNDVEGNKKQLVKALLKQYAANNVWLNFVNGSFREYLAEAEVKKEIVDSNKQFLANKQFIDYLVKSADAIPQQEQLKHGWILVSLCPGWVATDMGKKAGSATGELPADLDHTAELVVNAIGKMSIADSGKFYSLYEKFENTEGKGKLIQF